MQPLDLRHARLRSQRGPLLVAQHAEQASHLRQRLAPRLRRGRHRCAGALGRLGELIGSAVDERDHHRKVVSHDVVHVAGDSCALGGRRQSPLLVALELEARRALVQRSDECASRADAHPEHTGRGRQARERDPGLQRFGRPPARSRQDHTDLEDGRRRECRHRAAGHRHRVQSDKQRDVAERANVEQPLGQRDRRDRAEHRQRMAPAPQQRHRQRDAEREAGRPEPAIGRVRDRNQGRDDAGIEQPWTAGVEVDEPRRPVFGRPGVEPHRSHGSQDAQASRRMRLIAPAPSAIAAYPQNTPNPTHVPRWRPSSNVLVATVVPALSGR